MLLSDITGGRMAQLIVRNLDDRCQGALRRAPSATAAAWRPRPAPSSRRRPREGSRGAEDGTNRASAALMRERFKDIGLTDDEGRGSFDNSDREACATLIATLRRVFGQMIVLDTNVVSELMAGAEPGMRRVARSARAEHLAGARRSCLGDQGRRRRRARQSPASASLMPHSIDARRVDQRPRSPFDLDAAMQAAWQAPCAGREVARSTSRIPYCRHRGKPGAAIATRDVRRLRRPFG